MGEPSGQRPLLLLHDIEPTFVAIGVNDVEPTVVLGIFDLFTLDKQTPTVPSMPFLCRVNVVIALDQQNVGIDRSLARPRAPFRVVTAAYGGIASHLSGLPIPFLGRPE